MVETQMFRFDFVPLLPSYAKILEAMFGEPFIMYYDLGNSATFIAVRSEEQITQLHNVMPGIKISHAAGDSGTRINDPVLLVPYYLTADRNADFTVPRPISDMYELLNGENTRAAMAFVPSDMQHIRSVKSRIEEELSRGELRLTKSGSFRGKQGISFFSSSTNSTQMQLYYNSGERLVMESMLSMLNEALVSNGASYKVLLLVENNQKLLRYLNQKLMVLESKKVKIDSIGKFYDRMWDIDSMPFSIEKASQFIAFPERIMGGINIKAKFEPEQGSIHLGTFMRDSLEDSAEIISVDPNIFNLGTIITGLPGTGKTIEAMTIIKQIGRSEPRPRMVVISPTEEWRDFAHASGLRLVKLYDSDVKINFFKCDADIGIEKFYENLSMLIAFASNAGPYRNSLEKCLLAAFHRVYANTRAPDPVEVYEAVEEAVIEQHGKRTNVGVKYTKHGENVRAALENLRLMLFREEFSAKDGIDFKELLADGVVFDLSNVSNNMKAFFYALILNQVYSFADSFDAMGDEKLRMLICLEEAQLVFSTDELSATTADLRQRIQDFRKKGVGLILIAHGIVDINQGIRRLCQNKFYFRQSSDVTKYAAMDLGFMETELENVMDKLKTLEQRICAFSHVSRKGSLGIPSSPVFIKTTEYVGGETADPNESHSTAQKKGNVIRIRLVDDADNSIKGIETKLTYVGEVVASGRTNDNGEVEFSGILSGRRHTLNILVQRSKQQVFKIIAEDQTIKVGLGK